MGDVTLIEIGNGGELFSVSIEVYCAGNCEVCNIKERTWFKSWFKSCSNMNVTLNKLLSRFLAANHLKLKGSKTVSIVLLDYWVT